jgi:hypothetical protein
LLEPRFTSSFVDSQLLLQGFQGVKLLFFAEMVQEFEGQGLTIEVTFKIEEMHLDAPLLTIMKGGTSAHIEHTVMS